MRRYNRLLICIGVCLFIFYCALVTQANAINSLERRVTALQLINSEQEAFIRNQRHIDKAQDERINDLILSLYPPVE
jgi:hypothetical protein